MKQALTTFLITATIGLMLTGMVSCRKNSTSPDIKTYDQQQIQAYIQANNLTGYTRDLSGGDTTGIYYKILSQGTGTAVDYPDLVFFVYSVNTLDGAYSSTDTILNHAYNYVGHISPTYTANSGLPYRPPLPYGLQLAIINILKYRGTRAHVIIPSHLAFGVSGTGTGSNRITGNESLDYYINMVNPANQAAYDDQTIQNYMTNNGLSGYTKTASGLYYKVTQAGFGTNTVTPNSTIGIQFTGKLMDNNIFDQFNYTDSTARSYTYASMPAGWQEGFKYVTKGAKLSLIMPSSLGYGLTPASAYGFSSGSTTFTSAPTPNSCLYYDFNIESITN